MDWTYAQKERCWTIKGCPPVESPGYKKERKTKEQLAKIYDEWMWEHSWSELRFIGGDRRKWKDFVDNLCS
jgi:hypothetical protein